MNLDAIIRDFWRLRPGEPVTWVHRAAFWIATAAAYAFVGALAWAILMLAFLV